LALEESVQPEPADQAVGQDCPNFAALPLPAFAIERA